MLKQAWLQYASIDKSMLHGTLAIIIANHFFATTGFNSESAIRHYQETNKRIQDFNLSVSDTTIASICCMAIYQLIIGDRSQFRLHVQLLGHSASLRGGLEKLGMEGQLHHLIASCVANAAFCYWEHVPDSLKYPYGPLGDSAFQDAGCLPWVDAEYGVGFQELFNLGFLDVFLLDTCRAMVQIDGVMNDHQRWAQQCDHSGRFNKLSLRLTYVKRYQITESLEMGLNQQIYECIRLTVHFYLITFQQHNHLLSNSLTLALDQFCEALSRIVISTVWDDGLLSNLLLWIWLMIASADGRENTVAISQLHQVLGQRKVTHWQQLQCIYQRFLGRNRRLDRKTLQLWQDYVGRKDSA